MTLEEAIRHAEEKVKCGGECGEDHAQLAEWLKELQERRGEIIRCKDCKYWREYKYVNGKPKYLPYCGFNSTYFREDDYCSYAERREG